jgi:hypothetical protein
VVKYFSIVHDSISSENAASEANTRTMKSKAEIAVLM